MVSCADTIKIAAGIYKPSEGAKDSSFIITNNTSVLGGYPSTGNPGNSNRDIFKYKTILSGNVGDILNNKDNATHVVYLYGVNAKMDGVQISDGYGIGLLGNLQYELSGGGIYLDKSNLELTHSFVSNNYAAYGGGIYSGPNSLFKFEQSVIEKNTSEYDGGGLYNKYESINKNNLILNSAFYQNSSSDYGGGLYNSGQLTVMNSIFYGNQANQEGGGMYIGSADTIRIINSDFVGNAAQKDAGALYNNGNFKVANSVFYGNVSINQSSDNRAGDILNDGPYTANLINTCARYIWPRNPWIITNPINLDPLFTNINDPRGIDTMWFTHDDGLKPLPCSQFINAGTNNELDDSIQTDILDNPRIEEGTVDVSPYEFNETPSTMTILDHAADSIEANREYTDTLGWTNYYHDCIYLLSLNKSFSPFIGSVGDGKFSVKVYTTPLYGSGYGTDLSNALYVSPGVQWYVMNRYWKVNVTSEPYDGDSILVRFPYSNKDFDDVKGSNPQILNQQQMVFYKIDAPYNSLDLNSPLDHFHQYFEQPSPNTQYWTYGSTPLWNYADYYVKTFSGGGGGGGTGFNGGALPVKLVLFSVERDGKVNVVKWVTAEEINSSFFDVEKSRDAINFTPIAKVNANGNSKIPINYELTDKYPQAGINYYRLKIVDKDGHFYYSEIKSVNNSGSFYAKLYPNPVKDNLTLLINSDKITSAQIKIISLDGKTFKTIQTLLSVGNNVQAIGVYDLHNGPFFIQIITKNGQLVLKVLKE